MEQKEIEEKIKKHNLGCGCAVILIVFILVGVLIFFFIGDVPKKVNADDKDAYIICNNFVAEKILPIVADFSVLNERKTFSFKNDKNRFVIKSVFEINNGSLKYWYHCDVTYSGSGEFLLKENWKLNEIEIIK